MTDGRKRIARLLTFICITVVGGAMLTASPSTAEPEIADVRERVEKLYHEAEVAAERFNDARVNLGRAQERLDALQADLDRTRAQVEETRQQVASAIVSQAQGQAFSSAGQVALSESPDAFLEQLVVVAQHQDQQTEKQAQFAREARQLELREEAAKRELEAIAEVKRELAENKAKIDEKASEAQELLGELEDEAAERAAARAVRASRDLADSRPTLEPEPEPAPTTTTTSASGRAGAAVEYALAQVGDAYVWGATGPDGFDCSGLTMMAWAQAGVSLPHSSSMQMSSGTPVSQSQLQPGDLVFYYSPVSHVAIYIGDGKIVHAANPSTGVQVTDAFSMPYSGAVRPG
ncbi:MAG TPA: NlpC/P60 family protein [Nocardioidaceae bacterium]|nr:NlpC/P60 family protein [Nocardioidaceae bacterium]